MVLHAQAPTQDTSNSVQHNALRQKEMQETQGMVQEPSQGESVHQAVCWQCLEHAPELRQHSCTASGQPYNLPPIRHMQKDRWVPQIHHNHPKEWQRNGLSPAGRDAGQTRQTAVRSAKAQGTSSHGAQETQIQHSGRSCRLAACNSVDLSPCQALPLVPNSAGSRQSTSNSALLAKGETRQVSRHRAHLTKLQGSPGP